MEKLELLVIQISEKLIEKTPQALDMLLSVKIINSVSEIVLGIFLVILLTLAINTFRSQMELHTENYHKGHDFNAMVAGIFATLLSIAVIVTLFNPWTYVGIIHPELALAKDAIDSIKCSTK